MSKEEQQFAERAGYSLKSLSRLLALFFAVAIIPASSTLAADGNGTPDPATTPAAANSVQPQPAPENDHEMVEALKAQVAALESRVNELESRDHPALAAASPAAASYQPAVAVSDTVGPATVAAAPAPAPDPQMGNMMDMSAGPKLNFKGFLDFNFDAGSDANPLIYPLTVPLPTTVHNTFQFGEFDLFMSSKLSNSINFLSEAVFGSDASNFWGIDIERAQLSYKANDYFQFSIGRMHTAIGYYNTAYHHGTWFQTTTGRPFMYYYEDSGGILPVHLVGISATGLIPGSGKLNAHWTAELGNELSSAFIGQPIVAEPVQNFISDSNHKAFNVAGYIKPEWAEGLQIGANYYSGERVPEDAPHVKNTVTGLYAVYFARTWEFLSEFQDQRDRSIGSSTTFNTPLGYTQFSRKFGAYRPYFRWQEVNVPSGDPLYGSVGRYEGPSGRLALGFFRLRNI